MKKQLMYALAASCCLLAASCKKSDSFTAGRSNNQPSNKRTDVAGEMTGVIPTGVYRFVPETTDGATPQKAIGVVDSSSTVEGKLIESRDFAHNKGQEWQVTSLGSGQYRIVNINSGKAIDVPFGTADENEQVWQYTVNTAENAQKWVIEQQGANAYYRVKTVLNTAMGLHVAATTNGTAVRINAYAGQTANKGYFRLYRVPYKDKVVTNWFRRSSGWSMGDGATSIPLSNGKVLWLMDDSGINLVDPVTGKVPCYFTLNNCGIVQPSTTNWTWAASTVLVGGGAPYGLFRSHTTTGHYNWTSSGFELSGTAYIYCAHLKPPVGGGYPILENPMALGKFNISTNAVTGYQNLQSFYRADLDVLDQGRGAGQIEFGKGFIKEGGYVYAYGTHAQFITGNLYVARFAATTAGVAGAWSFWNGSNWVAGVNNAVIIGQAGSLVPFLTKIGSKYVMISSELSTCNGGKQIYSNTASAITGPFNMADRKVIYTIDDRYSGNSPWFYWAQPHPEFNTTANELLITYNLNGLPGCEDCMTVGSMDPDKYRPKAIRVPFKLIDSSL